MRRDEMHLRSPDRRKDREEMLDLVAKVFSGGGYYNFLGHCRDGYICGNRYYDWDASQIGILDGKIVTHYGVWGYDMRIGSALARCGGIGAVATHGDYRKRGLMAKTVQASIDAMQACGYDMSILFGIPNFYHKFGYVRSWSRVSDAIRVDRLSQERPKAKPRKFRDMTRADIEAIYAREHAGLTGTAVRPTYGKRGRGWHKWQGYRWEDGRGRTVGYVMTNVRDQVLECYEVGGDADEALRVLAMLTRKLGCRELKFVDVHQETPIIKKLRRGDCTTTINSRLNGGPMIRTINLTTSLTKMCGELSRRLRASHVAGWRGKSLIADAREKVTLAVANGKVSIAKPTKTKHAVRGGDEIAQLLIGTNDPAETIEAAGIRLSGDAKRLVPVLFPAQHPMLCPWDGY